MRQKKREAGPALLVHELVEMVLFLALPRRDTKPIARALLARFGGFAERIAAANAELREVEGLGEAGVEALRLSERQLRDAPVRHNWDRLLDYRTAALSREGVEQFRVLVLDARNRLLAEEIRGPAR